MKTLAIDIETAPNLAHVWGLWNQNVGLSQLIEPTEMLCFAAKWLGSKTIKFYSQHHDGHSAMVERAHELLDEADAVLHYNGKRFDVPHLNREFLALGLAPPSPYRQIDLLATVKKQFNFPSNKLDHVSRALGLPGKVGHEGHTLWIKCMAGDPKAWARMKRYNKQDVALLEDLYDQLKPWIKGHPHVGLIDGTGADSCLCGSTNLERRGYAYTAVSQFQQYRCRDCGRWVRGNKAVARVDTREVAG